MTVATQSSRRVPSDTVSAGAETSSRSTVVGLVIGMAIIASAFAIGCDTSGPDRGLHGGLRREKASSGALLLRPFLDARGISSLVADTGDAVDPPVSYAVWRTLSPSAAAPRRARPLADRGSARCFPLRVWR
jgi:hypothetical protein